MSAIRISPSVLNANQNDLLGEIDKIKDSADFLHLDIMDGVFVPNSTYTFEVAKDLIERSPLKVDAHLMVANPDVMAPKFAESGCLSVTYHFEATNLHQQILRDIKSHGSRAAIAIKPNTALEAVADLLPEIDMLLIMTVEPGFGGQKFMVDMMPKLRSAKELISSMKLEDFWLQVDGGISLDTIEIARKNGADTFVAGSAVYQADSPAEMVGKLRTTASISG
jgi:ribulose-phosphate 3-epimerase